VLHISELVFLEPVHWQKVYHTEETVL